ncbi:matrix Gla protein [Moschus berezovskii]|uniref:matrix Gla protein n=1 Tax=Moschus berezovskii TaxID=68408 RepID=UPI002444F596|nr:matrix Gla protein [Moschus berezovskii]
MPTSLHLLWPPPPGPTPFSSDSYKNPTAFHQQPVAVSLHCCSGRRCEWPGDAMKSLLLLSVLAALAVAALCYESHESLESYEINPFINRRNANTFISPQQRWRVKAQERIRELNKPQYELNREACDDFKLCERYAMVYGYNAAYDRYFRQRRGAK